MFGGTPVRIADLSRLKREISLHRLHAAMGFSQFPAREAASSFRSLKVMMSTEATDLIQDGGKVIAACTANDAGRRDRDQRRSDHRLRRPPFDRAAERAGLAVEEIGAPMDVLWFRAGKRADETENVFARIEPGKMMVTFDRGDYWQCAYVIAKGQYDAVKARGLACVPRRRRHAWRRS